MFLFFIISFFVSLSLPLPLPLSPHDSSPLSAFGDQVRQMHLYTESKHINLFLEILPNGTITGAPTQTQYTVLELKALRPGQTVIWGVMSSLYLCVDGSEQLIGRAMFLEDLCSFSELLQSDGYTYFLSAHRVPLTLKQGFPFARFLPLRNALLIQTSADQQQNPDGLGTEPDLDSDDPLGLRQSIQNLRSPIFHMER